MILSSKIIQKVRTVITFLTNQTNSKKTKKGNRILKTKALYQKLVEIIFT